MSDQQIVEEFITKPYPKDDIYNSWLGIINKIEKSTINSDDSTSSLDIAFILFPLIDTISLTLFKSKSGRKYLEELNISHPYLVYEIFRHGMLHKMSNYHLVFDDSEVTWTMSSSSGSGGFLPYDEGYLSNEFPEDNLPAEEIFTYEKNGNNYIASLSLDRLAALIRHDLIKRRDSDKNETMNIITGKRIHGRAPTQKYKE